MKKVLNYIMIGAVTAALFTTSSCTKTCDPGYEGSDCKTEVRSKFINASGWSADETGSNSGHTTPAFTVNVTTSSTDVQKIYISNVWNTFTHTVVASVSDKTFTIARQEPDGDQFFVSGSGTVGTDGKITVSYTVTDESVSPATTDVVTGTWTKK